MAWGNQTGGSHAGADWTISSNTTVNGVHTDIGTFTINNGITATVGTYVAGYGSFEVNATNVVINGVIDAIGAGYLGGNGGQGGNSGDVGTNIGYAGASGAGYGGGSAGYGAAWQGTSYGGNGGGGGNGGYLASGINGDTTIDELVYMGSGGAGGGGGMGGNIVVPYIANNNYAGGGAGGGGAGGKGGGVVKLVAVTALTIASTGVIYSRGVATGGNGTAGGQGGGVGNDSRFTQGAGGAGGTASSAGTGAGAAGGIGIYSNYYNSGGGSGGAGGVGGGGGCLLKCATRNGVSLGGTIDLRGGGLSTSNGGTLKLVFYGNYANTSSLLVGRLAELEAIPPAVGYVRIQGINGKKLRLLDSGNAVYNYVKVRGADGTTYNADIHNLSSLYPVRVKTPAGIKSWRHE